MNFSDLLQQPVADDFSIQNITDDSRAVTSGDIFVFDQRILPQKAGQFCEDAQRKGARLVISNMEAPGVFYHPQPGELLARWARAQHPQQPAFTCAVTGTNGKTSVAWFVMQLLASAGKKAASIGTLGVYVNGKKQQETGYTSPTALVVHRILHDLSAQGVQAVCLEASSHALELRRLEAVNIHAAAFTNLTQDHLDFHGNMAAYGAAKMRLFSDLLAGDGTAVLNIQRPECWPVAAVVKQRDQKLLTFGSANAELSVKAVEATLNGLRLECGYGQQRITCQTPLLGDFQGQNVAAAMGLAMAAGVPFEQVCAAVPQLHAVPGRMEKITSPHKNAPLVVVDYAHTDDALAKALQAMRHHVTGRLHVVFGCGGNRDSAKRVKMGAVAARYADTVFVTDDNPRHEDAAAIRAQVMQAVPQAHNVGDRRQAIAAALHAAAAGDGVLIAGKGHEQGQIVGDTVLPFDDRTCAAELLAGYAAQKAAL